MIIFQKLLFKILKSLILLSIYLSVFVRTCMAQGCGCPQRLKRMSDLLGPELLTVGSLFWIHHLHAGNGIWVLWKSALNY